MADQSPAPDDRFKAEMPAIPGVAGGAKPPSNAVAPLKIVGGLVAVLVVIVAAGSIFSHSRRNAAAPSDASSKWKYRLRTLVIPLHRRLPCAASPLWT